MSRAEVIGNATLYLGDCRDVLPTPRLDFYAVGNDLRVGVYPGTTVETFGTHWDAVARMLQLHGDDHAV